MTGEEIQKFLTTKYNELKLISETNSLEDEFEHLLKIKSSNQLNSQNSESRYKKSIYEDLNVQDINFKTRKRKCWYSIFQKMILINEIKKG